MEKLRMFKTQLVLSANVAWSLCTVGLIWIVCCTNWFITKQPIRQCLSCAVNQMKRGLEMNVFSVLRPVPASVPLPSQRAGRRACWQLQVAAVWAGMQSVSGGVLLGALLFGSKQLSQALSALCPAALSCCLTKLPLYKPRSNDELLHIPHVERELMCYVGGCMMDVTV